MRALQTIAVAGVFGLASAAEAVIVNGGSGTQNPVTSPPLGLTSQFSNMGSVYDGSCVYLGNGYVLTVSHTTPNDAANNVGLFGAGDVFFPSLGTTVQAARDGNGNVIGAQRLLTNGQPADLSIFKLATTPALPGVTIGSVAPIAGNTVTMVGNGRVRLAANANGYDVAPTIPPANTTTNRFFGYATNIVAADADPFTAGVQTRITTSFVPSEGQVVAFATIFDNLPNEGQVATGDSGGSAFNALGELVGTLEARATSQNQPADTVYYGNYTFITDLTVYKAQIDAITSVPEPTSIGLLGLGTVALLRRVRK